MGALGALVALAALLGCSSPSAGPCAEEPRHIACGRACPSASYCPSGFHCDASGRCDALCDAFTGQGCPSGRGCTPDGRCISLATAEDGAIVTPRDGSPRDPNVCAEVALQTRRQTPNVMLVVDQSGSMNERFSGGSRWNVLRDALLAEPGGLIASLEDEVRFGLALYSARADDGPAIGMCPMVETVPFALNNHEAIARVYRRAEPIDETPTGESIDFLLDLISSTPDPPEGPTILVLATDGEPDTCAVPNPQRGQPESIAAVERGYRMGIRTFIISVGRDTVSETHLQEVANAGVGRRPGDDDAPYFVAGDDDGLRSALRAIVGGALGCVIDLEGRIDMEQACTGRVELNGHVLPCNDPNGWQPVSETTIELRGEACDRLQGGDGADLVATFPCNIVFI